MNDHALILGVSLKLYLDVAQTTRWAGALAEIALASEAVRDGRVRLFALPSLPSLPSAQRALAGTRVAVGAQDLYWEDRGAFTGAVSGADLREIGCTLVEIGHAERRHAFGEDDTVIRAKLAAAIRNGLTPVLCVGEQERCGPEDAAAICVAQLDALLAGTDTNAGFDLIVAYEPEWAIGVTEPAEPDHVRAVGLALRDRLRQHPSVRSGAVIYGGSAKPGTLTALHDAVDGLFLGRFAHDPAALRSIATEAASLR